MSPVWHALLLALSAAAWFVAIASVILGLLYGMSRLPAARRMPR